MRLIQRLVQAIERRLARGERLGVAHELEARVDGLANDVRDVVEIQRADVLRPILQPERAESPVERICLALVGGDVVLERGEARALRQVASGSDAMSKARVPALQESNDRRDRRLVDLEVLREEPRGRRVPLSRQRAQLLANGVQPLRRQQP